MDVLFNLITNKILIMALSTCSECKSTIFEVKENTPATSNYKLLFVQCASCGTVVGVMDYYNIGHMLHKQNTAIKKIAQHLNIYVDLD